MSSLPILQSLKESILTANVKAVYGEPIAAQGKTVIPVAKLIYGFGGGAGTGGVGNSGTRGEGGGGGNCLPSKKRQCSARACNRAAAFSAEL